MDANEKVRALHPDWAKCKNLDELANKLAGNALAGHYEAMRMDAMDCMIRAQQLATPPESAQENGWLRSGSLLYRLTDERRPQNRDEINVTMANGSRSDEAREARAVQLLAMLAAPPEPPTDGPYFANKGDESERYAADVEREPAAQEGANPWREVLVDELVTTFMLSEENQNDPRKALMDVIEWHTKVALDPAVSAEARALVERGAQPVGEVDEAMVERACAEGARQAGESWPLADDAKSAKLREHMRGILTAVRLPAGAGGDDKVLWGVVANAGRLSSRRVPRWAHVVDATGQGSTSAAALCSRFGFDPDEQIGGRPAPPNDQVKP